VSVYSMVWPNLSLLFLLAIALIGSANFVVVAVYSGLLNMIHLHIFLLLHVIVLCFRYLAEGNPQEATSEGE
jgi:hypothetical protein